MSKIEKMFRGKKTYIAAAGLIAYAILGVVLNQFGADEAVTLVLNGFGLGGLRHAMETKD